MGIWMTDAGGARLLDGGCGAWRSVPTPLASPCCPCATREWLLLACRRAGDVLCLRRDTLAEAARLPALPALCGLCVSPCGRYLYQLGEDADCVHTHSLPTGELMYAQPAGVFPRAMRLHPSGRYLAVAGGASGEALLLSAPDLHVLARGSVRGVVRDVDFWHNGLLLACTTEEGDLRASLQALCFPSSQAECLWSAPGQAGAVCAVPHRDQALLGTLDGLTCCSISHRRILWRLPLFSLASRLERNGDTVLISNALGGQVAALPLMQPLWWRSIAASGEAAWC